MLTPAFAAALLLAPCDESGVRSLGELDYALSQKAVEAIRRAHGSPNQPRLDRLIAPSANFVLGAGDVGRPLGQGVAGARAMAETMNADSYRFYNWSGIPTPAVEPCGKRAVDVEFISTSSHYAFRIRFEFDGGRIVSAAGWTTTFTAGPLR